jgi:hypothetical protein
MGLEFRFVLGPLVCVVINALDDVENIMASIDTCYKHVIYEQGTITLTLSEACFPIIEPPLSNIVTQHKRREI